MVIKLNVYIKVIVNIKTPLLYYIILYYIITNSCTVVENFANNIFGYISKFLKSNEILTVGLCYMIFLEGVCPIIKKMLHMNLLTSRLWVFRE